MAKLESAHISGNVILQPGVAVDIALPNEVKILTEIPLIGLSYDQNVLADNPIAYWRCGDASLQSIGVDDISGRNGLEILNGAYGAAGLLVGDPDTSRDFVPNGYVRVLDDNIFSFTDGVNDKPFTIEGWFNLDSLATRQPLITKTFDLSANRQEYAVYVEPDGKLSIVVYNLAASQQYIYETTTSQISINNTYHFIASYGGSINTSTIRLNGAEVAGVDTDIGGYTKMSNSITNLNFGRIFGTDATFENFLDGRMGKIAIYDKVLSADRALAHYNAGV